MTIRACILATLCVAGLGTAATAAPPATPVKKTVAAEAPSAAKPAPKPAAKAAAKSAVGVRTIDAINIEGEIVVPQVLFITSRDNRRYRDGLGKNFRMGTLDVARSLATPNRLCVAAKSGTEALKEE